MGRAIVTEADVIIQPRDFSLCPISELSFGEKWRRMWHNDPIVGVQITSEAIYYCCLYLNNRDPAPKESRFSGVIPLERDTVVDGAIMNMERMKIALERLKSTLSVLRGKPQIVLGINGHLTIFKRISLPAMSEAELRSSAAWEAEQYIPFDIKEVYFDMVRLNLGQTNNQIDVGLAAAKKDAVDDYRQAFREVGLEIAAAEPEEMALIRAVFNAMDEDDVDDKTIAVASVSSDMTLIVVMRNGEILFQRAISLGTNECVKEIQIQLSVSYEEALEYMRETGEIEDVSLFKEVAKIREKVAGKLVTEILGSLEFFKATEVENSIDFYRVCGDGAADLLMLAYVLECRMRQGEVTEETKTQFAAIDPITPFLHETEEAWSIKPEDRSRYTIAIGLALREQMGEGPIGHEVKAIRKSKRPPLFCNWRQAREPKSITKVHVTSREIVLFFFMFAALIDGGIPLIEVLNTLANNEDFSKKFREAISRACAKLATGSTCAEAFSAFMILPKHVEMMIVGGEMGGRLDWAANQIVEYYKLRGYLD